MAGSAKNTPDESTPVPPRGNRRSTQPTPRTAAKRSAASGKASARQAAQQRQRRRRTWIAAAATAVVVVVIVVLVVVGLSSGGAKAAPRTPVPPATSHALQSVPLGTLVAASSSPRVGNLSPATPLNGPPLKSGNKPEFLYIGAEFCPICAAQRWPMVVALSQFGTFTNLQQTRSAVRDGDIATLSFYGSSYSSPYLTFTPVETTTNQPKGNYYQPLETPTPQQQALWSSTLGGNLTFPFLYIGGKYVLNTSQYPANLLIGHSFDEIASSVGNNNTTIGANIDASAAALVKYVCGITGQQPAATCAAVANVKAPVASSTSGPSSSAGS
jgi:hypothetical protein